MVRCSVAGCSNSSTNNDLSFHHLPKSTELHKKWFLAMRRVDIEENQKVVLCSAHFNPEDFKQDLKIIELQLMLYLFFIYIDIRSFIKRNQ